MWPRQSAKEFCKLFNTEKPKTLSTYRKIFVHPFWTWVIHIISVHFPLTQPNFISMNVPTSEAQTPQLRLEKWIKLNQDPKPTLRNVSDSDAQLSFLFVWNAQYHLTSPEDSLISFKFPLFLFAYLLTKADRFNAMSTCPLSLNKRGGGWGRGQGKKVEEEGDENLVQREYNISLKEAEFSKKGPNSVKQALLWR